MTKVKMTCLFIFIMMTILVFITTIYPKHRYYLPNRTMWVDAQQQTFWKETSMGKWLTNFKLLDERCMKEFKMTYRQFCKLVDMLSPYIKKQDTNMRAAFPIDKVVAIAVQPLYYGSMLYMARHHLGNLPSISSKFTHNTCEVLVIYFYNKYIQILKGEALQEIMANLKTLHEYPTCGEQLMESIFV
jgi:hypothetical protein